jgi:hypothetical protein
LRCGEWESIKCWPPIIDTGKLIIGGKLVSFFSHLFNKKKQAHDLKKAQEGEPLEEDGLEEDPEDEPDAEAEEKEEITPEIPEDGKEYEVVEIEIHPAKIICPDCGGITLEGLEFCDKCGGELQ